MPAEIDTGGPRVLHCVKRADCPIPRSPPIVSSLLPIPAHRSSSDTTRRPRHRRCRSTRDSTLPGSSPEPRIVPGNDEPDQFFRGEGSSATVSATSSSDLRDRQGRKRGRTTWDSRDVPDVGEIGREEVVPVEDTGQRILHSTEASPGHLVRENRRDDFGESSAIAIRLFDGCGSVESVRKSAGPILGTLSAASSSQRDRPPLGTEPLTSTTETLRDDDKTREYCGECAWQCGSECVRECPSDESRSARSSPVEVTRERRKRHRYVQHEGRSSLQLAFILLLLALGHGSLFKSNSGGIGVGAGIGAVAIGTLLGTVQALPVDLDAGVRAERSANLSHITGASRKIQMYVKNRHLQILPDGSVNGSNDDTSEYTIFQRTSVSRGQLRIQGVATCLYLCMDSCGLLYGSREYTDDCVFNETLEQHNYNTYSSVRWSTAKKTLYLGLNRRGQPRRVQAKGHNLGRLSAYARVLTQVAAPDRVEALQARMLGAQHNLRHHHNSHHHRNMQQIVCPSLPPQEKDGRDKFRCRKRKKRKKRKRRCKEDEKPGPHCDIAEEHRGGNAEVPPGEGPPQSKRSCEGAASEELCRKQALDAPAKKRKSRIEPIKPSLASKEKQQRSRGKEVRLKKTTGSVDDDSMKKVNGSNGGKRKRPPLKQRPGTAAKRKVTGRVPRTTTVAASPTAPGIILPSSWYPGASTTPTTEVSSWRRTKTAASPKNAVTSGELKTSDSSQSTRNGKALEPLGSLSDGFVTEASVEAEDHYASLNDSSAETSDEAKSDESNFEDEPAYSSAEYSTLMTTMDTTPPERTEDYTRATTPTTLESGEVQGDSINESQVPVGSGLRVFGGELEPPVRRLAM